MYDFARNYKPEMVKQAAILKRKFAEFCKMFPEQKDSVEEIVKHAFEEKELFCQQCGSTSIFRQYGEKTFDCLDCRKKGWVFVGTFFEKMRIARLWHATIWLLERKIIFNARQLSFLCQVAYSSALFVYKKLAKVILTQMMNTAEEMLSENFISVFSKRSRETPAGEHPKFEQFALEQSMEDEECVEEEPKFNHVTGIEKEVYELISDKPIHVDKICQTLTAPTGAILATLTLLELDGFIKAKGGDYYFREKQKRRETKINKHFLSVRVDEFTDFIRMFFHGISRKYLQFYLAVYYARTRNSTLAPGQLIDACLEHEAFPYKKMLEYISPLEVVMAE